MPREIEVERTARIIKQAEVPPTPPPDSPANHLAIAAAIVAVICAIMSVAAMMSHL